MWKKKKKNKNKNKDTHGTQDAASPQSGSNSYAEAAAQPLTSEENDVVLGGVKHEKDGEDTQATNPSTTSSSDAQALEASIDEIKNEEENQAEAEMQPEGLSKS